MEIILYFIIILIACCGALIILAFHLQSMFHEKEKIRIRTDEVKILEITTLNLQELKGIIQVDPVFLKRDMRYKGGVRRQIVSEITEKLFELQLIELNEADYTPNYFPGSLLEYKIKVCPPNPRPL